MFLLSFILVLAAAGLLIAGLAQGSSELIWGSIAASILAAIVLVVLVTGRRRSAAQPRTSGPTMQDPARRAPSVAYDDRDDRVDRDERVDRTPVRAFSGGTPGSPQLSDEELAARVAVLESELDERNSDHDEDYPDQIDEDIAAIDAELDEDEPSYAQPDSIDDDDEGDAGDYLSAEDDLPADDEAPAAHDVPAENDLTTEDDVAAEEQDTPEDIDDDDEVASAAVDSEDEPDEEQSSDADVALVSELDQDVFVIDGRPRYHLYTCPFLKDRDGIPIPLREAREDGFSPCARCTPDAVAGGAERRRLERAARATSAGATAPKIT